MEIDLPPLSPPDLFSALRTDRGFLLESLGENETIARYSFLGVDPRLIVTIGAAGETILTGDPALTAIAASPDGETPVDWIRSIIQRFCCVHLKGPRFFGGMVGYFGYDLVYFLSPKVRPAATGETPVACFMLATDCIIYDHVRGRLSVFTCPVITYDDDPEAVYETGCAALHRTLRRIRDAAPGTTEPAKEPPAGYATSSLSRAAFMQAVGAIQEHIRAGDIYQAVLSRQLDCPLSRDPFAVYRRLRAANPSPYMYYFDPGGHQVIGSSPEMLVRVEEGQVMTVPIAGTRSRGRTAEEDEALAADLLADEKERAEHVMLVDLARNDVGRVSRFGSVTVEEFMSVERFSHVQHIVSTVSGRLRDNLDCFDVLKACFPAGTVSGAPKVRAMQIIEELEGSPRGAYAGAVGYIGFNRSMDLAIAIRTILARDGRATVRVGAGIVADSRPESEWEETVAKGRAMLEAIGAVEAVP